MKKVSRKKTRIAIGITVVALVLLVLSMVVQTYTMDFTALLALGLLVVWVRGVSRCPNCGAYFRGLHWSAPDAGHCSKCGELIEYDDAGSSDADAQ